VLVRSGQEAVVVNLDLPNVEPNPEEFTTSPCGSWFYEQQGMNVIRKPPG
jgi:hypothetical protein